MNEPTPPVHQPTRDQVVAALRRNSMDVPRPLRWDLQSDRWLVVQLDHDGGVALPPADYLPGPDCFGHLKPRAECVGRGSCMRARACSE